MPAGSSPLRQPPGQARLADVQAEGGVEVLDPQVVGGVHPISLRLVPALTAVGNVLSTTPDRAVAR
jgi:hypothetical protein